jgi:type IV pilus assembly protein PilA
VSKKILWGYSLIELMMVVAIMGILTVIAVPCYQNYTKRARFSEVIAATEPFKLAIAIALQTGTPTAELNSGIHGIPASPGATKNLASISVKQGVITATGSGLVDSNTYILVPDNDGSAWAIAGSCLNAGMCDA